MRFVARNVARLDLNSRKAYFSRRNRGGATGDRTRHIRGGRSRLSSDREVETGDIPATGADTPLNKAPLDPVLDHERPVWRDPVDVEAALAKALVEASAAGRFDVVALLAKELEARRLALAGVVTLDDERAKRRPR
jgi:hypothetical protein